MGDEEDDTTLAKTKSEEQPRRKRANRVKFPRRTPSVVVPERRIVYISADKTTCAECPCFPKEDPYRKPKKLNPCQKSPLTLYELAANVMDQIAFPGPLAWSVSDVADWMERDVGFPEYRDCILNNRIDGMRLLMLEDPSKLPEINIHYLSHIKTITRHVRLLYGTDFVRFARSVGLPPRYPVTHCTWFKSRTGPSWGIKQNWTRYIKPDFPKVMFGRVGLRTSQIARDKPIPQYESLTEPCLEYMVPRKFRLNPEIPNEKQMIWMEHQAEPKVGPPAVVKKKKLTKAKETRLMPKKINLAGLRGKELVLARRLMAKPKFF